MNTTHTLDAPNPMSTDTPTPPSRSLLRWSAALATDADAAAAVARIALGVMILPHGLQKTLGWFGGFGFTGTMSYFTETMGIALPLAFLAIAAESLGGVALIVGLGGRLAAMGVGTVIVVAALTSHVQNGFFMNWFGTSPAGAEGWEFHLLAAALALVVVLRGSGALSLDRELLRHRHMR
jgi:putative oxidoreductase